MVSLIDSLLPEMWEEVEPGKKGDGNVFFCYNFLIYAQSKMACIINSKTKLPMDCIIIINGLNYFSLHFGQICSIYCRVYFCYISNTKYLRNYKSLSMCVHKTNYAMK